MKLKIEDIMFWILIALIIGLAIWKLIGSPTDTASLISLALFVAGSEIIIWKSIFKIDKNTAIGFAKIKGELDNINYKLNKINDKLDKK